MNALVLPRRSIVVRALALSIATCPCAAYAQATLEEIIVTAQKREQSLQDVPIAVSVVNDDFVEQQGIIDIRGLDGRVPSLTVTKTPFQPVVNLRGLGSGGGTRSFEQSVAMYVDGVYAGRANQFLNPFFDIDRVEVVRGPQGVLFGVNAVAGGINIVNKQPSNELEGFVATSYEFEHESWRADGALSIPLTDTLAVRLAVRQGEEGGYLRNVFLRRDEPKEEYHLYRAIVRWTPTEALTVQLTAETSARDANASFSQMYAITPFAAAFAPAAIEDGKVDFKKSSSGLPEFTEIDSDNYSLNVGWELGQHTLTSITGYSEYDFTQAVAAAPFPIPVGRALGDERYDQTYQELRLTSPGDKKIDYVIGAAYYRQHQRLPQGIDLDLRPFGGPPVGLRFELDQETTAYAAFGQLTYRFTDVFRAVVGMRYSEVNKDGDYLLGASAYGAPLSGYTFDPFSAIVVGSPATLFAMRYVNPMDPTTIRPSVYRRSKDLSGIDPSVSLQWDVTDDIAGYFTFSKARKAGGFDDQHKTGLATENGYADEFEFDPEEAKNHEIGAKLNFARWRFNAAVFHTEFENLQVSNATQTGVRTTNAAQITSRGVEIEATALISDRLEIGGDLTYLDAKYDDFPGVGCPVGTSPPCVDLNTNAKGKQIELAPEWAGNLYVEAAHPITSGLIATVRANAYYNDGYSMAADQDPLDVQSDFWRFDASVSIGAANDRWQVMLLGKNLNDEAVISFGGDAALGLGHAGMVSPGRQLYLDARWNF